MNADDRQRLQFALEILDRERDAHKILADFLEELGDVGHAQWARSRKNSSRKRLEFAISLLPASAAVQLGCDFIERFVERQRGELHDTGRVLRTLANVRSYQVDETHARSEIETQAEIIRNDRFLWFRSLDPNSTAREVAESANSACSGLANALFAIGAKAEFRDAGDSRKARHAGQQCRLAIRNLCRHARDAAAPIRERSYWDRSHWPGINDELRWQIEQTKTFVTELLQRPETW